MALDPLKTLHAPCLALPETAERVSHGEPTWFVRDAFRAVAPRGLAARLDDEHPGAG